VLLEQQLALEFFARGLIEHIYPVMIGDKAVDIEGIPSYGNYFADGCDPEITGEVIVDSVYGDVLGHLQDLCLGTPLHDDMSVGKVKRDILVNQGRLIQGPIEKALEHVLQDSVRMLSMKGSFYVPNEKRKISSKNYE
jgi:hypothetical protein